MLQHVLIGDNERILVIRKRRFVEILGPGERWLFGRGVQLTQAVQSMDDTGEFTWRLANAVHGHTGFLQALAGWHESLDAKAFQQEQAAAHGVTSALVLWSGLFVAAVAISAFMFLTSLISSAALW